MHVCGDSRACVTSAKQGTNLLGCAIGCRQGPRNLSRCHCGGVGRVWQIASWPRAREHCRRQVRGRPGRPMCDLGLCGGPHRLRHLRAGNAGRSIQRNDLHVCLSRSRDGGRIVPRPHHRGGHSNPRSAVDRLFQSAPPGVLCVRAYSLLGSASAVCNTA